MHWLELWARGRRSGHTFGVATTSPPLPPIPTVTTIDGVVEAIGSIIDWSISVSSRLGYFAAMYKRITIAIGTAVSQGEFQDGPRMQRFDVAFATRYFDALNGYFHPTQFAKPTRSWRANVRCGQQAGANHPAALVGRCGCAYRSGSRHRRSNGGSRRKAGGAAQRLQHSQRGVSQPGQRGSQRPQ